MNLESTVGPQLNRQDGVQIPFRGARDGSVVVRDGAARYAETTLRGNVFSLFSGQITAAEPFNKEQAAGTAKLACGIHNPTNSGVNAVITDFVLSYVEGTKLSGPFVYSVQQCPAVKSAASGTIRPQLLGNTTQSKMIAQNNATIERQDGATTALTILRLTGGSGNSQGASALAATTPEQRDRPEGEIVIPPGTLFGVSQFFTGEACKYVASVTWEEIPG
jgi:hypothetical protein